MNAAGRREGEGRAGVLAELQAEFASRFAEQHGLKLRFKPDAVQWLVDESSRSSRSIRDLYAVRFEYFQFGLRLIEQNTGRKEFEIDECDGAQAGDGDDGGLDRDPTATGQPALCEPAAAGVGTVTSSCQ